jgi:membrane protein
MKTRVAWELLKETFRDWKEDKAFRLSAALAYYTVFSIAPLLIIVIAVAAAIFGREAAEGQIVTQLTGLIGKEGAETLQTAIQNSSKPKEGVIATIISVFMLIFASTGVFSELQGSLNTIWEVEPKPGRGFFAIIKDRFISFSAVLGIGFLLLVSLVISAAIAAMGELFKGFLPMPEVVFHILNFVISFALITLLFAMIFKFLPDVKIAWKDVWIGAALTALLFTIGKFLIGLYLGKSTFTSTYGAAGALLIILLWAYYSSLILFFGAEFTQVYANRCGSRVVPSENALPVSEEKRTQEGLSPRRKDEGTGSWPVPKGAH